MSSDAFDDLMASLDAPMAIVTTAHDGEAAGCLIGFHAQSSIKPGRYCIWISKANHTYRVLLGSTHLAVHYLTTADRELATLFGTTSGDDIDKFEHCGSTLDAHGVPVLDGCPNHLVARRIVLLDEGGDHVCVVTEPVVVRSASRFTPLRLSDVEDLVPGHESEERNDPLTERAES